MEEEQIRKAVVNRDPEAMEWVMNHYAGFVMEDCLFHPTSCIGRRD